MEIDYLDVVEEVKEAFQYYNFKKGQRIVAGQVNVIDAPRMAWL